VSSDGSPQEKESRSWSVDGLSQDRAAERLAEQAATHAELAEARAVAQQAQQEIAEVRASAGAEVLQAARAQIAEAFLQLVATGEAPTWLAEVAPTAAETLPLLLAKGRRLPRGTSSLRREAAISTAPEGSLDALRELLRAVGIIEAGRPDGKRGVWVPTSAVDILSGGEVIGVDAAKLTREKGSMHKEGRYYIAPADALIVELGKRKQLRSDFAMWLDTRQQRTVMDDESSSDTASISADASTIP
jgi:murein L,D-transpeptidase YcbB/YkuD